MAEQKTEAASGSTVSPPHSGNPVRLVVRIILFAILAYLVCALPYEFLVARAGEERAWNELQGLLEKNNTKAGRPDTTDEVVHERLKLKPTSVSKDKHGFAQETYTWRRGLPWQTFNIYVTYYPSIDKKDPSIVHLMLDNAHRNETPDQLLADMPKHKPQEGEGTGGPPTVGAATGGMPGGAGGAGARPSGLAPPPGLGPPPGFGPGRPSGAGQRNPSRPDGETPAGKPDKKPDADEPAKKPADSEPTESAKPAEPEAPKKSSGGDTEEKPE